MLAVEGVERHFSGLAALSGVDLEIEAEEIVGLVGPNGSGKSTLLGVLSAFIRADRGAVRLDGRRIDRMRPWSVAQLGVHRTFQVPAQPERMTVLEVMLTGADLPVGVTLRGSLFKPRRAAAEQRQAVGRARDVLERLTLLELEHSSAASLSGGQQKLLSFAVALMSEPRVLLLDEPTAGVHPQLRGTLIECLRDARAAGTALVVVEHDMGFVSELCERVYVLDKGAVVTCCAPSELARDPRVIEAYLGTKHRRASGAIRREVAR